MSLATVVAKLLGFVVGCALMGALLRTVSLWYLVGLVGPAVAAGFIAFRLAGRRATPRGDALLPAFAVLVGQAAAFAFGLIAIPLHQVSNTAAFVAGVAGSVLPLAAGLVWLVLRPGSLVIAALIIYQCVLAVTSTATLVGVLHAETAGANEWTAYAFHMGLKVLAVVLMVRGLRAMPTASVPVGSTSPLGHGEGI